MSPRRRVAPGEEIARWDRWSRSYDRGLRARLVLRPLHRRLVEQSRAAGGERALDVGAGTGSLLAMMAERGARAFGADPSAGMIAVASSRAPGRVVVATAEALPFASGSFDLVVTSLSMHHWHHPGEGVSEAARVLAPGGRALFADLERRGLLRRATTAIAHLIGNLRRGGGHSHHLSRHELADALRAAGLVPEWQRARRGILITLARRP